MTFLPILFQYRRTSEFRTTLWSSYFGGGSSTFFKEIPPIPTFSMGFVCFANFSLIKSRLNRIVEPDKPTCKMRRWLGRCAAKGHFAAGDSFFNPSAAISIFSDGVGASKQWKWPRKLAITFILIYFDLFRFISIYFDLFRFISIYFDLF